MKMYAMRKIGFGYTSGKTTDFTSAWVRYGKRGDKL